MNTIEISDVTPTVKVAVIGLNNITQEELSELAEKIELANELTAKLKKLSKYIENEEIKLLCAATGKKTLDDVKLLPPETIAGLFNKRSEAGEISMEPGGFGFEIRPGKETNSISYKDELVKRIGEAAVNALPKKTTWSYHIAVVAPK